MRRVNPITNHKYCKRQFSANKQAHPIVKRTSINIRKASKTLRQINGTQPWAKENRANTAQVVGISYFLLRRE